MAKMRDPVCGAEVDTDEINATVGEMRSGAAETDPTKGTKRFHNGEWYYFDTLDCRVRFMADPDSFLKAS